MRPGRAVAGRGAPVLLAGLLLAACGVDPQDAPQPVPADRLPSAAPGTSPPAATALRARVWGVRDQRLVPVFVQVPAEDVDSRVRALLALADSGQATTAIARGTRLVEARRDDAAVVLVLSAELRSVAGRELPLALAQLVFTVTEVPGVRTLRVEAGGEPVLLVNASGRVVARPLQRSDFPALSDLDEQD